MKYNPQKHHRRSIRLPDYDYASPGAYFVTVCVRGGECLLGQVIDGEMQLSPYGQVAHAFWEKVPAHFSNDAFSLVSVDGYVTMPNHIHAIIVIHENAGRGAVAGPSSTPQHDDDPGPGGTGGRGPGGGREEPRREDPRQGDPGRGGPDREESGRRDDPGRGDLGRGDLGRGDPGRGNRAPTEGRTTIARPTLGQIVGYYKYQTTKMINQMVGLPGVPFWQRNYWEHIIRNDRALRQIREYVANNPARWEMDQLHPDAPPNRFNRGER